MRRTERIPSVIWRANPPKLGFATPWATDAQAQAAFNEMDADDKGHLVREEVEVHLRTAGYGEPEIEAFFKRTDTNLDGKIVFEEFKRGWTFLGTFTISNHEGDDLLRKPDSLRGTDLVVEECKDTTVALCDHSSQVQVDALRNCRVLVGPCAGSVFVRNCSGYSLSIAARQLRVRDCTDVTFYLYTCTEPVIEASSNLRFAPFNSSYPQQSIHFTKANLDPSANLFWAVYDFHEGSSEFPEPHWQELPDDQWEAWDLTTMSEFGEPECAVPRDARAPIPADSMRGRDIAAGGVGAPAGPKPNGFSRLCAVQ